MINTVVDIEATEAEQSMLPPWVESPYRLVSWWSMQKFTAERYFEIAQYLADVRNRLSGWDRKKVLPGWKEGNPNLGKGQLALVGVACQEIGLRISLKCIQRIMREGSAEGGVTVAAFLDLTAELEQIIIWEMEDKLFMFIPPDRADYYDKPELFGESVAARFPILQFDITEAGNCYASGRSTAVVFHLMRVMESLVQEFANVIGGITLPADKDWNNILDEINREIKKLRGRDARTISLAASAANLYNVKVAWRNPTMHPKQTYTMDEADDIMRAVKTFVKELVEIL